MTYDIPHVQEIATTVLAYEADKQNTSGYTKTLLQKVKALTTGEPSSELGWWTSLEHGALPHTLPRADYTREHPLEMAVMFPDNPSISACFLARMAKDLDVNTDNGTGDHWRNITTCYLPAPENPRLRFSNAKRGMFHPSHAAWYTTSALIRVANEELQYGHGVGHFLMRAAEALARAGMSPLVLQEIATKCAVKQIAKKATSTTDYIGIAEAIWLSTPEAIEQALAKESGVFKTLGVTLKQASPATMIAGLRAIAANQKLELLRRIARPITLEELLASNVKGAVEVWRQMPWPILQPLVRAHGNELRAALLQRSEVNPDQLRTVLADHPDRFELYEQVQAADDEDDRWQIPIDLASPSRLSVLQARAASYFPAVRLQQVLEEAYPPEVAKLIALRHLSPDQHRALGAYVEPILTDAARAALISYTMPPR